MTTRTERSYNIILVAHVQSYKHMPQIKTTSTDAFPPSIQAYRVRD